VFHAPVGLSSATRFKDTQSTLARPSTPLLSRARIARTALELIDEQGFDALTTRRLARRLGVSDPSLYNHISSRDDLLDEVHALIIDEELPSMPLDGDWRTALAEFARSYRRAFARHPHVIATIARRPISTPVSLRLYEDLFRFLEHHGFDAPAVLAVTAAIDFLCLGAAIEPFAAGYVRAPSEYEDDYPHLARALKDGELESADERGFELALAALVDRFALIRESGPARTRQ
jgi:AcrR family transcriptional regulator